ncbi:MAG: carboxypeptidase M32, partial [Kiloniellales bacterium]
MSAYEDLERRFRRLNALSEAAGLLHWDMATMMPPGGAEARGEQLAALDLTCHELLSAPEMADLLAAAAEEAESLEPWARANLRDMRRRWRHESALEPALVEALSKVGNACEMVWREARAKADFAMVLPKLEELLGLTRQAAAAKAVVLGCPPYDALLDQYEPGGSSARIDAIFDDLAAFLPEFLGRVLERQAAAPAPLPHEGPFPVGTQRAFARRLMETVGFDFEHGRLDESLHPFCGGVPEDLRITTRYDEADFMKALMGVLHETGHAMYERGLPAKWRLQPVGEARG